MLRIQLDSEFAHTQCVLLRFHIANLFINVSG